MILIAALALLNVFSKLQLSGGVTKYIGKLSPLAFGVYLVHTEPHIWNLLKGYFAALANTSSVVLLLGTVGATVAIWSVCLLVDYMRFTMFKVCKLPQRCKCLEEVIVNGFARFVSRLKKR